MFLPSPAPPAPVVIDLEKGQQCDVLTEAGRGGGWALHDRRRRGLFRAVAIWRWGEGF